MALTSRGIYERMDEEDFPTALSCPVMKPEFKKMCLVEAASVETLINFHPPVISFHMHWLVQLELIDWGEKMKKS